MTVRRSVQREDLSFSTALTAAMATAARAPSSHNSQPWGLAYVVSDLARRRAAALCGDNLSQPDLPGVRVDIDAEFLLLAADRARELAALPAHHAEMQLSCGLYWRLLQRALAAEGWIVRTEVVSADLGVLGLPADWRPLRLARLERAGTPTETRTQLRDLAAARHTDRGPYLDKPIPVGVADTLARRSSQTSQRIDIRFLTSEDDRSRFVRFVARHAGRDFAHPAAWRETHSFIRRSETEARERGDGFSLEHLFGPLSATAMLLRRIALAPITMRLLRPTGFPRILAAQLAALVRQSPAVLLLSLPEAAVGDDELVAAGQLLTDFWLLATDMGLVLHPISVVIQHDDLHARLCAEFGLAGLVFFVARLGYSAHHCPPSPRRSPAASLRTL
ncbi:hypothetical protein [Nocardia sp. NPDC051832]|uniref:hypothetical protein n=1 Tax=Nocardia sp. NPDC051832 TaxID=3155673 RepID=UPI0034389549